MTDKIDVGDMVEYDGCSYYVLNNRSPCVLVSVDTYGNDKIIVSARQDELRLIQKGAGLDVYRKNEVIHLAAMKISVTRTKSYMDAMAENKLCLHLNIDVDNDHMIVYQCVLTDDTNSVVYTTKFVVVKGARGTCQRMKDCPVINGSSLAPDMVKLFVNHRCHWRWMDVGTCPEDGIMDAITPP